MNRLRPLASAVLATLMLIPTSLAEDVLPLDPGGGLPPINETGPAGGTELVPPPSRPSPSGQHEDSGSSESDYTDEPPLQTRHFGLQVALSCTVAPTPNALVVVNQSAEELPPGTRIKWQIRSEGKVGFFALLGPLSGGETLIADNVLDDAADKGAECIARVI
jgi:hypothetical protein